MADYINRAYFSISNAPSTTGAFTVSTAESGYRTLVAADDGKSLDVLAIEGTAWEVRTGCAYTHSGTSLARGTLEESSTGSAIDFTSAAKVMVTLAAGAAEDFFTTTAAFVPGGRLTLESGVPVSTTDQTSKTTVYYTPYVHDRIALWNGARWVPVVFAEKSVALGTLTSGKIYDVFGYLSSGELVLELSAQWTDDTTRADAVSLQDGRYCKTSDKTRLLLGSFYTASTTTTSDAQAARRLFNVYNRVQRMFRVDGTGEHTYGTNSWRNWNNTETLGDFLFSLPESYIPIGFLRFVSTAGSGGSAVVGVSINNATPGSGLLATLTNTLTTSFTALGIANAQAAANGRNVVRIVEISTAGTNTYSSCYYYASLVQ